MRSRILLFSILISVFLFGVHVQICEAQQSLLKQEYSPLNFSTFKRLAFPEMIKELELTKDQNQKIRKLWLSLTTEKDQKFFSIPSEQLQQIIDNPKLDAKRKEDMRKWAVDANLIARSQLETILTDKQQSRILELSIWRSLDRGVLNALKSEPFKSIIENAEASKLVEKFANENRDEIEKELAALKKKFRDQLNKELTEEQRKKLSETLGTETLGTKTLGKGAEIDPQPENKPQLGYWSSINESGYSGVILSDKFAKQLGVSKVQQQNLLEKSKKLQQEFNAEVLQLRLKFFKQILDKSGVGEMKKVKDLVSQLKNPPKSTNPIPF